MGSLERRPRGRINLRVDADQETRLRAAAEANGETLTSFLLAAATERANAVLARAEQLAINEAAFARFVAALDGPPEPIETLSRYGTERSPIPTVDHG